MAASAYLCQKSSEISKIMRESATHLLEEGILGAGVVEGVFGGHDNKGHAAKGVAVPWLVVPVDGHGETRLWQ
jgi:hypothetical protein